MIRMTVKYLALVGLLAILPATALAQHQTITLASGDPAHLYTDSNGNTRDRTIKVTRYQEWPPICFECWTAADYAWSGGVRPPLVTEDAYAIDPYPWAWAVIPGVKWVNYQPTPYSAGMSYFFDTDRSGPYHASYDVSFAMPAHFTNATVEIQYAGDDWMNAYMNGRVFVDQHSLVMARYFDGQAYPDGFCTFGCISTATMADAAQFLVPGTNILTVHQWDPDGAGGATFLVKVSYDTDPLQALLATLEELRIAIATLPSSSFKNANNQKALLNSLAAEVKTVQGGSYLEARDKMAGDLLAKMNGFATVGGADANDQIVTADGQAVTYPLADRALVLLNSLL